MKNIHPAFELIPDTWKLQKASRVIDMSVGGTPPTSNPDYFDGDVPWLTIAGMDTETIYECDKSITREGMKKAGIRSTYPGDLLYSFKLSIGKVAWAGIKMATNEAIASIHPSSDIHLPYARWVLPMAFQAAAGANIYGASLLNQEQLRQAMIPLPPREEQQKIADYLDRETAEIDQLLSDYQALTVLLTERLSATVTTLTRPEDARPAALRHLADVKLGKMLRESDLNETARLYLRAANIQEWGRLTHLSDSKMMNTSPAERSALALEKNDVVLVEGGAGYGKSAVLEDDLNDWIFQNHVFRIRARESVAWGPYLHFALLAEKLNGGFDVRVTQATIPTLSTANLASVEIMAPSKQRQIELSAQIAVKVESALQTLQDLSKAVLLAQERRAALISAAVTGQIDVTVQGASAAEQLRDELEGHV